MNVHFSFKAAKTPDVEHEIQQQIEKLGRRLQVFRPELVHLHGAVAPAQARAGGIEASVNLRLPSGQMVGQETAPTAVAAIKAVFRELTNQLNAHKDLLRNRHKWRRLSKEHRRVPFEQTLAAVSVDGNANHNGESRQVRDVNFFVNTNLDRLNRFIERELQYRINIGELSPNLLTREEVLDETIAAALSEEERRPESLNTERWLYGLALRSIHTVAQRNSDESGTIHMEAPAGQPNVTGSDEAWLQFHQPDDFINEESIIADPSRSTPEAVAASDEFISQIESTLAGAKKEDREAFVLFVIEGFSIEEISQVTNRTAEDITKSIEAARDRVQKKIPPESPLKKELLKSSRIA